MLYLNDKKMIKLTTFGNRTPAKNWMKVVHLIDLKTKQPIGLVFNKSVEREREDDEDEAVPSEDIEETNDEDDEDESEDEETD